MDLNFSGPAVIVGGMHFASIKSLRGTSPVEGLHVHQKQWLGMFGQHDCEVGAALLKDGAWRWNRTKSDAIKNIVENCDVATANLI